MTQEQREAVKYFEGVKTAYEDCASIAENLAASSPGFVRFAVDRSGVDSRDATLMARGGEEMAKMLASGIREKLANILAMIDKPPSKKSH